MLTWSLTIARGVPAAAAMRHKPDMPLLCLLRWPVAYRVAWYTGSSFPELLYTPAQPTLLSRFTSAHSWRKERREPFFLCLHARLELALVKGSPCCYYTSLKQKQSTFSRLCHHNPQPHRRPPLSAPQQTHRRPTHFTPPCRASPSPSLPLPLPLSPFPPQLEQ